MTFGERLRKRRRELDMTQAELAEWVGHTQPCITYWERGRTEPGLTDLKSLGEALGVTIDWLVLGGPSSIISLHNAKIGPSDARTSPGRGTEGESSMQGQGYTERGGDA